MFKRILVPLDGSARAEHAIPVAARLARAAGGSVVLVQVATVPVTYSPYLASSSYAAEAVEAELNDAESYLNNLASSEVLRGIETETKALFGAAAPTILSVAHSYNVDLVVMTSQGKTGMKRWVLGSVAQKIARHSPIPVFILHEGGPMPAAPHPDGRPMRALVSLDGSALAKAAIEPAAQLVVALSTPAQGALHLIRVVKPPTPDETHMLVDQESIERFKENALHKAKTYLNSVAGHLREGPLKQLNLSITWSVAADDDVAHAIIRMAENGEDAEGAGVFGRCDLIAMATHGRGGFQHWVLGSVTERVLGATKLPVLIVRPEETESKPASDGGETSEAQIQTRTILP
jgi:nucleotide-binding universal stress UspA family protein